MRTARNHQTPDYPFLAPGSEMAALTSRFNWASTPLGGIDTWPQSLRTSLDILFHAKTAMLLWWSEDLIQFYNDAYRQILGTNGKHPRALGQRAVDCWPEIWDVIKPLIDTVWAGGSIMNRDQLIPIHRNGRIESVYWTFGYSPLHDESGNIAGILVVCQETTEQVNAVTQLIQRESILGSIVEHAPIGICIVDGQPWRAEIFNQLYLSTINRTREELENNSFLEVFSEEGESFEDLFERLITTGRSYRRQERELNDPSKRYIDYIIQPFKGGPADARHKIMIIVYDVTEKVLARKKVEESELRYRTLISECTVAIGLYLGPDIRIQYVNEVMVRYWGKDFSVVGKTLREALPELHGQRFLAELNHAYQTGEPCHGSEVKAILNVGGKPTEFYFDYDYKPLRNSEGKVYGILQISVDVTGRVLARKKLEYNESILKNLVRKAPVAMTILRGPEFVVEIANERIMQLWGKSAKQVIGKPIFEGLPEALPQGYQTLLRQVYKTGESYSAEALPFKMIRDGSKEDTRYINFVYEPYRNVEGAVTGIIAVATDVTAEVTARHKVEELVEERTRELAELNRTLEQSNEELAQFAYIASHDLQEPARKIRTFIEMLQSILPNADPPAQALLRKIENASARMLTLIRDVLTYSQVTRQKHPEEEVDLNQVLEEVLEDFELKLQERQAILETDALPSIFASKGQISQLFANLISNALKFTKEGEIPRIKIQYARPSTDEVSKHPELPAHQTYHRISLSDNGIGFHQKYAGQIFDIFQRLHVKSAYEGTGIGLAICKKIAENHNGAIVAESVAGMGATFHIYFPDNHT